MQGLELSDPIWQLIGVVVFIIPGLNTTWVVERLEGRSALRPTERLLRAVSWSMLIYLPSLPWLWSVGRRVLGGKGPSATIVALDGVAFLFLLPVALGFVIVLLRRAGWLRRVVGSITRIHPAPTAWDFAFGRLERGFVRLTLRNGRRIGGYYAGQSFSSAYPEAQELFLQEAWKLDDEGEFVEPVHGTVGVLVRADSVERIELLQVRERTTNG